MKIIKNTLTFTLTCLLALFVTSCDMLLNKKIKANKNNTNLSQQENTPIDDTENELQTRAQLEFKVLQLFQNENFAELDKLAMQYQNNNERTSSGLWKLTIFHSAFDRYSGVKDEEFWKYYFETVNKWIEHSNSPTAHITKAQLYRNYAWSIRGGGYAKDVPDKAWKPFKENLSLANEYLDNHKETASVSPQWYSEKLDILTGLGKDTTTFNQVFDEGVDKFPDYYQIYFNAMRYLTPKWYGNKYDIEAFANRAVEITKDNEGMGMYARIYWTASQGQYDERLFYESDMVWKKMKQGIFDVLERYPDQWNIQNFAYFSCLAKDKTTTRQLIERTQEPIIMEAWKNEKVYNTCKKM